MVHHSSHRILIVGGGIAGLSIAARVAHAGLPVTLVEAARLGEAASTRNQGWLHSGAWFARQQSETAKLCHQALQQTLRFCPECVEDDPEPMVYITSRRETDPAPYMSAWDAAGILYERLPPEQLFERFQGLSIAHAHHAFQLPDRSMRPDALMMRLAEAADQSGVEIRLGTRVSRLLKRDGEVHGVELGTGEVITARLVILAGNARGGFLLPDFGAGAVGPNREMAVVGLKTHLVAVRPAISRWPLCVLDADGFNHIPHSPMSVFGTGRWLTVRHGEDEQSDPAEIDRIWKCVGELFPDSQRENQQQVVEWAGATAQAMSLDQVDSGQVPLPTVIDHAREREPVENLLSVFPGRATLWTHLAERTTEVVLTKLGDRNREIARPPWA